MYIAGVSTPKLCEYSDLQLHSFTILHLLYIFLKLYWFTWCFESLIPQSEDLTSFLLFFFTNLYSYNISCYHLLLFPACGYQNVDWRITVSCSLSDGDVLKLFFAQTTKCSPFLNHDFRYCAVAPTVLAGRVDPVLFEALYVSSNFCFSWS